MQKRFELGWVATNLPSEIFDKEVTELSGILMSMGTPYADMNAALKAIRYARENKIPLMAICGGFT